ncbi:MAG TPA: intradiol ring-cleavage dioxygenase [Kofleriaceae bacterium]
MATHHDDGSLGLLEDLRVLTRRRLFGMVAKGVAGLSLLPILADCATDSSSGGSDVDGGSGSGSDGGAGGACSTIPEETAGPYPGDGTNGPNALTTSGIVRGDIRTSFGAASGTAAGIPLTVTVSLVDSTTCSPLAGYAVYIWHCDRDGNYSMYSSAVQSQNYLRGVQVTDDHGSVTFTSIFPACYSGRWPHIHFEVYASAAEATGGRNAVATSQMAMPKAACDAVYATTGYSQSVNNLSQTSLASDMVFSDGTSLQIPTISGSTSAGYAAALTVAIAV